MLAERYQQLLALISNEGADMYDRVDAVESAVREQPTVGQRLVLLRACLASSDVCIRQVGVRALGADHSPKVTEVLRGLLQDPAEPVQEAALAYLAARKAPGSYEMCAQWLCHGTPYQRRAALHTIGQFSDEQVVPLYEGLWQSSSLAEDDRVPVAVRLLRAGNRVGVPFLEQCLRRPEVCWRAIAAAWLACDGHPGALEEVVKLAHVEGDTERQQVRFLFRGPLGVPHNLPDPAWAAAVLARAREQRPRL